MITKWIDRVLRRLKLGSLEQTEFGIDFRIGDRRLLYFNEWDQTCNEIAEALKEQELKEQEAEEDTARASTVFVAPPVKKCLACGDTFQGRGFRCEQCIKAGRRIPAIVSKGPYPR